MSTMPCARFGATLTMIGKEPISLAQDDPSPEGSWVHAYLHRKEGDLGNASYWYHRAGRRMPTGDSDEERSAMVAALIATP